MQYPTEFALDLGWLKQSSRDDAFLDNATILTKDSDLAMKILGFSMDKLETQADQFKYKLDYSIQDAIYDTREEANTYTMLDAVTSASFVIYDSQTGFVRRKKNLTESIQELEAMGVSKEELIDTLVTSDTVKFKRDNELLYNSKFLGRDGSNSYRSALLKPGNESRHYSLFIRGHGDLLGIRFGQPHHYKILYNTPKADEMMQMARDYENERAVFAQEEIDLQEEMERIHAEQRYNREHTPLANQLQQLARLKIARNKLDDLKLVKEERERIFLDQMRELGEMAEGVDDYNDDVEAASMNDMLLRGFREREKRTGLGLPNYGDVLSKKYMGKY
jgi:hypothetical protein